GYWTGGRHKKSPREKPPGGFLNFDRLRLEQRSRSFEAQRGGVDRARAGGWEELHIRREVKGRGHVPAQHCLREEVVASGIKIEHVGSSRARGVLGPEHARETGRELIAD